LHTPPEQTLSGAAQVFPAQHAPPGAPHVAQIPLWQVAPVVLHVLPLQHTWPRPPHVTHSPLVLQAVAGARHFGVVLQQGVFRRPQSVSTFGTTSARGPSVTGPSVVGRSARGPSVVGRSARGPSVTGPSCAAASLARSSFTGPSGGLAVLSEQATSAATHEHRIQLARRDMHPPRPTGWSILLLMVDHRPIDSGRSSEPRHLR
jgi:hypothetical protein